MAQDLVESYIKKSNIWSQEGGSLNTEYAFRSDFSNSSSNLKNTRTPTLNEDYLLTIGTHTDYDTYYYVEGGWDHYNNIYVTTILNNDTIILSDNNTYIRKYPEINYISNLSNGTDTYVIKDAEARTAIANKQDTLVSGTNIKTINNTSILGSGNISITQPSIATTSTAGLVKPDGTTVTITNDGTISASSSSITFRTWSD